MAPDTAPQDIAYAARGDIDPDLLTKEGTGGRFMTGYFADGPLLDHLESDEQLHYVLTNLSKGVDIETDGESTSVEPDSDYRSAALVTDRRTVFVVGQADSDQIITVPHDEITSVTAPSGLLKDKLVVATEDTSYSMYTTKGDQTQEVADYITTHITTTTTDDADASADGSSPFQFGDSNQPPTDAAEADQETTDSDKQSTEPDRVPDESATRSDLLAELRRIDDEWSQQIDRKLLYSVGEYHPDQYETEFGSLEAAIAETDNQDNTGDDGERTDIASQTATAEDPTHDIEDEQPHTDEEEPTHDEESRSLPTTEELERIDPDAVEHVTAARDHLETDNGNPTRESFIRAHTALCTALDIMQPTDAKVADDIRRLVADIEYGLTSPDDDAIDDTADDDSVLTVHVIDHQHSPVADATITVSKGSIHRSATTDSEGISTISVPDEITTAELEIEHPKHPKSTQWVRLGWLNEHAIELEPPTDHQPNTDDSETTSANGDPSGQPTTASEATTSTTETAETSAEPYFLWPDEDDWELQEIQDGVPQLDIDDATLQSLPETPRELLEEAATDLAENGDADHRRVRAYYLLCAALPELDDDEHQDIAKRTRIVSTRVALTLPRIYETVRDPVESPAPPDDSPTDEPDDTPTRTALLTELTEVHEEVDRLPKPSDIRSTVGVRAAQYYDEFGSWDDALDAAGIDKRSILLKELERLGERHGDRPTPAVLDDDSPYDSVLYEETFGSWEAALDASALDAGDTASSQAADASDDSLFNTSPTEESTSTASPVSEADVIDTIQKLHDEAPVFVKPSHVNEQADFSATDVRTVFDSWENALQQAGIDKEAALKAELRRVRDEVGHPPTTTDMNEYGHVSATLYQDYFDSFASIRDQLFDEDATESSSSDIAEPTPDRDDITDDLRRVERIFHRHPTRDEYGEQGEYPIEVVEQEFGDWDTAVATAFEAESKRPTGESVPLRWDDIPDDERLSGQIPVQVETIDTDPGARKSAMIVVSDIAGNEFLVNIWEKHPDPTDWRADEWYRLEGVRGTVWNHSGDTRKLLDSTEDFTVEYLGGEPPDDVAVAEPATESSEDSEASDDGDHDGEEDSSDSPVDALMDDLDGL